MAWICVRCPRSGCPPCRKSRSCFNGRSRVPCGCASWTYPTRTGVSGFPAVALHVGHRGGGPAPATHPPAFRVEVFAGNMLAPGTRIHVFRARGHACYVPRLPRRRAGHTPQLGGSISGHPGSSGSAPLIGVHHKPQIRADAHHPDHLCRKASGLNTSLHHKHACNDGGHHAAAARGLGHWTGPRARHGAPDGQTTMGLQAYDGGRPFPGWLLPCDWRGVLDLQPDARQDRKNGPHDGVSEVLARARTTSGPPSSSRTRLRHTGTVSGPGSSEGLVCIDPTSVLSGYDRCSKRSYTPRTPL